MNLPDFKNFPARTQAEIDEWNFKYVVCSRLEAAGFDERFFKKIELVPKQLSAYRAMKKHLTTCGAIVALVGIRGTGKTSLCSTLAQERAAVEDEVPHVHTVLYRKMARLVMRFKPLYADYGSIDTESSMQVLDGLCGNHNLLVIDEVHETDDNKMKNRILVDIIDRRYAKLKDTILISNQTPAEFRKATSDSILSRLSEHGTIINCNWTSFRGGENG